VLEGDRATGVDSINGSTDDTRLEDSSTVEVEGLEDSSDC
jgi:hypothetical protein